MEFFECMFERRSCRAFKQDPVPREDIDKMIDAARYAPTGYNNQPVRYAIINSPEKVAEAFQFTFWLTGNPADDEHPVAFIVVMNDTDTSDSIPATSCAAYAIMLAAHALGYESCWHGWAGKPAAKEFLGVPDNLNPRIAVSLGKPAEKMIVHDPSADWKPRKDDDKVVHLGKFARDDVTVKVM